MPSFSVQTTRLHEQSKPYAILVVICILLTIKKNTNDIQMTMQNYNNDY